MKVYKDGANIVIEEAPGYPVGKVINIPSSHARMDEDVNSTRIAIWDALYDAAIFADLLANITDDAPAPQTVSGLRAIIGS